MNLDTFPPKAGEDSGISRAAANHLGEDGGDRSHREVSPPHLGNERADAIPSPSRTACDRRDRLAV